MYQSIVGSQACHKMRVSEYGVRDQYWRKTAFEVPQMSTLKRDGRRPTNRCPHCPLSVQSMKTWLDKTPNSLISRLFRLRDFSQLTRFATIMFRWINIRFWFYGHANPDFAKKKKYLQRFLFRPEQEKSTVFGAFLNLLNGKYVLYLSMSSLCTVNNCRFGNDIFCFSTSVHYR